MIRLIQFALRRPISILVFVIAIILSAVFAIRKFSIDIFPTLNAPTIYVAQTYGGMSPQQMEGFITSYYEYHFLYITGIKSVESKSIQGLGLIKLEFHENTNMANAMAEVIAYVNRSRSFMPSGTLPPFVMRYDAGSVPIGQLVFTSESRSLNEIQDLALFKVRPMFAALSGVSAPPPLGGNQRTVVIKADPERLRSYNITAEEVVTAIAKNNVILPSGTLRMGDKSYITTSNSVVDNIKELENVTIKNTNGTSLLLRDVANVDNGADVTTGYALINGKRSIYIPVTKRADASTWEVVQSVKKALPDMQAAIPEDIKVSYEFDQSGYVINSLKSLMYEGLLGALLTGLMVLIFLKDIRSALIVIINIPLALLASLVCLYLAGQTINIMTIGGLALAVGILIDESTITIENIHHHLESGKEKPQAVWDACKEIALPKILILLSILAVFVPALFMNGISRSMFMPLSLSVGFAVIASFLLSQTLVPILAIWLMKKSSMQDEVRISESKKGLDAVIESLSKARFILIPLILIALSLVSVMMYQKIGKSIFPKSEVGQLQVRLRMPVGTRIERTEDATKKILGLFDSLVGKQNVAISSAYVGLHPPTFAITPIFLFTSGPHEALIKVNLKSLPDLNIDDLKEQIRTAIKNDLPGVHISFEPADLVDQVMSMGTTNPIDIVIQGRNLTQSREIADRLIDTLHKISYLRDIAITQPLDYPTIQINYDRLRVGQMGLTVDQAGKSVTEATSSSRLTQPVYWLDKSSGNAYQVQVEYPQLNMNSPDQLDLLPVGKSENQSVYLRDVAEWKKGNSIGEYDRINQQRFISISANIHQKDLGSAIHEVNDAIKNLTELPTGVKIYQRGQSVILNQSINELTFGLLLALIVIVLMLSAYFQSFGLAFIVISVFPGVVAGSMLLLWITGHSLNIQSFTGCIMALGIAVSNAILIVTNAESIRTIIGIRTSIGALAISNRLRPILMTTIAMIAGMLPMAIGLGENGNQTASLGIAVIGGLIFSTIISISIVPVLYDWIIGSKKTLSISLDPTDPSSKYYAQNH